MANTERIKVLQLVRIAKDAVNKAREDNIDPSQNSFLEELSVKLEDIEGDLILFSLDEKISELQTAAKNLQKSAANIKKDIQQISKVADMVDKAAKAMKTLVDIVTKASTL